MAADDPRIADLLRRYQDELAAGRMPDVSDWCVDAPELLPEFLKRTERLEKLNRLLAGDSSPSPPEPDTTLVFPPPAPAIVDLPCPPGYEILSRLGVGGMGIVYKAVQKSLGRVVALKMLPGDRAARELDLARFLGESHALAAVPHPNIVPVFENGVHEGHPYFSMEYCPGGTLSARLGHRPQDPRTAAAMMRTIALAAHHAHLKGIVHRDLKPGNILSTAEPTAGDSTIVNPSTGDPHADLKITDFGLAKRVDDLTDRTLAGDVLGTPSYMSPEQARGKKADIPSDVWSLGAMLYECLTGLPPFVAPSAVETLELVRKAQPAAIRPTHPKVPVDLETICLKCLREEPRNRYESAAALADDLTRFLAGMPIKARPIGRVGRAWSWFRRDPYRAGLTAAGMALVVLVTAGLWWERVITDRHAREAAAARDRENVAIRAALDLRYQALMAAVQRLRLEAKPGWTWEVGELLDQASVLPAAAEDEGSIRNERAAAAATVDARPHRRHAPKFPAVLVAHQHDGRRFALAAELFQWWNQNGRVHVIGPGDQVVDLPINRLKLAHGLRLPRSHCLAFSPDDRWLAHGLRGGAIQVWDLRANQPTQFTWQADKDALHGIAFDPKSTVMYTTGYDGTVKRWPLDKPGANKIESRAAGKNRGLVYWPGPRPGVLVYGTEKTRLLDPETLRDLPFPHDGHIAPDFGTSNGKLVAHLPSRTVAVSAGPDLELHYWHEGICERVHRFVDPTPEADGHAHARIIEDLAMHPTGMLLATASPKEGMVKVWNTTTRRLALSIPLVDVEGVGFSPDGRRLFACGDSTTYEFELSLPNVMCPQPFPILHFSPTECGGVAVISGQHPPGVPERGTIVAGRHDLARRESRFAVHQPDVAWGASALTVAHDRDGPAFHVGDGTAVRLGGRRHPVGEVRDVYVCPHGDRWEIQGAASLHRHPRGVGPPEQVRVGKPGTGRTDLKCVRSNGKHTLVGCDSGHLAVVVDGRQQKLLCCFRDVAGAAGREQSNTVQVAEPHPDGQRAVAGTEDGRVWLWDLQTGERLDDWKAHGDRVTTVAFDGTGNWLATGGRDARVQLWRSTPDGYRLHATLAPPCAGPVRQVAFVANGTRLLSSHDGESALRSWSLADLAPKP